MTYELAAHAQQITRLSHAHRLVLMHLCQVANAECDWKVWHAQEQIAIWNGMSEKTVREAIKRLGELKLIRTGRFEAEMMGRNVYQVDTRRVELMAKQDRLEADEKVQLWRERGRENKTRQRVQQQIRRSLRVVPDPVENPVDKHETGT